MSRMFNVLFIMISVVFCALMAVERPLSLTHEHKVLETDKTVTWGQLDNGLIYGIMPNNEPKDKLSIRLYVRVGSMQETELEQGLAHYLEHMGFNGSKNFPVANQVVEELQKIGVAFGRDSNAHTSFDETVYKLDMPDAQEDTLKLGLKVFSDWAAYLHNNEKEVNDERGIILSEMRDRDGPQMRIWQGIYPRIFPGLTLGKRFPIGTKKSITEMTAERIQQFYKKWYRPERMVLTVVGAIEPSKVTSLIEASFAEIPKAQTALEHPEYGTFLINKDIQYYAQHELESDSTFIYYSVTKPHNYIEDGLKRRRLALHKRLVNSIMNRRLQDYVEDNQDGPILSGGLSLYSRYGVDIAAISVQPKPGKSLAAVAVLEQELRRFRTFGPTNTELNIAIANIEAGLEQSVARKSTRSNRSLATSLYTAVKYGNVFQTPEQNRDLIKSLLKEVTLPDVQASVDIAFNKGSQFIGLFGRDGLGDDAAQQLQRAFEASTSVTVEAPASAETQKWAYAQRPNEVQPKSNKGVLHNIRQLQYENNVAVNLLSRDEKKNEILFQLRVGINKHPPKAGIKEGFRALMGGGLNKHDPKSLRQVLAGKRASVNISAGYDAIVIGGSCPPEELELLFQLATAWLNDAGWRDDGFKRMKTSWLESLAAQKTDIDAIMSQRMSMLMSGALTHNRNASLPEARALTWLDVKTWAEPILQMGSIECSIVGDFSEEKAIALSNAYLGSLTKREPLQVKNDLTIDGALEPMADLPSGTYSNEVQATVERALIRVVWQTDDAGDVKQVRRLSQLSRIVSDKLRKKIREQLGDAYSPYATNYSSSQHDKHGYFLMHVGIAPDRVDAVLPVLKEVIADLLKNGISDDLFQRVMTPTIRSLPAYRSGNGYWLNSVVRQSQSQPQRMQWATQMEDDYKNMQISELMTLANKYLRSEPLEVVIVSHGKPSDDPTKSASPSQDKSAE